MEVSNFHNDVILAAQCRGDVDKFCKDVPPGVCGGCGEGGGHLLADLQLLAVVLQVEQLSST